jgi:hypothetical protein
MKKKVQICFERGTNEAKCKRLLLAHDSELMGAADVNGGRVVGQHKAYLPLPEEGLILMCCGRVQAEKEGMEVAAGAEYVMVAWTMAGEVGRYILHHMATDPNAVKVPLPPTPS